MRQGIARRPGIVQLYVKIGLNAAQLKQNLHHMRSLPTITLHKTFAAGDTCSRGHNMVIPKTSDKRLAD